MKYRIEQNNQGQRTIWVVKQGRKVLSHHQYRDEAQDAAQRYVAEDRDFAMEG